VKKFTNCGVKVLYIILLIIVLYVPNVVVAASAKSIPVLVYHRVGDTADALTVKPEKLRGDLINLKNNGYQTISLKVFEEYMSGKDVELPDKPILVTFDDSYQDNYENAFPILKENQCVATFFVITWLVDRNQDRLTSAEIKAMAAAGMSFGSHTVSHTVLVDKPDFWVQNELAYSKQFLEELLGTPICSVAYPEGKFNANTIKIAIEQGYSTGFTVEPGKSTRQTAPFKVCRIPVFSYTLDVVKAINNAPD